MNLLKVGWMRNTFILWLDYMALQAVFYLRRSLYKCRQDTQPNWVSRWICFKWAYICKVSWMRNTFLLWQPSQSWANLCQIGGIKTLFVFFCIGCLYEIAYMVVSAQITLKIVQICFSSMDTIGITLTFCYVVNINLLLTSGLTKIIIFNSQASLVFVSILGRVAPLIADPPC